MEMRYGWRDVGAEHVYTYDGATKGWAVSAAEVAAGNSDTGRRTEAVQDAENGWQPIADDAST